MDVTFPFEYVGKCSFGSIFRPRAKVSFQVSDSKLWTTVWMVVDSGADFSILPRYVSSDLSVSLERDCILDQTEGVGGMGQIYLYKKKISAKMGSITRSVPIAFSDNDDIPPLLGRLGFLETFDVTFSKHQKILFRG